MTTAGCPVQEPLHKIVYELLCALHGQKKSLDSSDDTVKLLLNQLILIYDQKIGTKGDKYKNTTMELSLTCNPLAFQSLAVSVVYGICTYPMTAITSPMHGHLSFITIRTGFITVKTRRIFPF
uniref:Cilia- and flagella-associated protein 69 n=1 Tax=Heterorhabditis bacteriophora TaxID=37862 RepID=A0A1I7WIL7_HETBA